ncbi:hypothetical protein [Actinoplanes sp. NPDC049265]
MNRPSTHPSLEDTMISFYDDGPPMTDRGPVRRTGNRPPMR